MNAVYEVDYHRFSECLLVLLNQRAAKMADQKLSEINNNPQRSVTALQYFAQTPSSQQDINDTLPAVLRRECGNLTANDFNVYLSYEALSRGLHVYLETLGTTDISEAPEQSGEKEETTAVEQLPSRVYEC